MSAPTMRAVELEAFGGAERPVPVRLARPEPAPDEVLVRVRACGVCGHDLLARRGRLGGSTPRVLGHEIAGEVAAVGADAGARRGSEPLRVGDRVVLGQRVTAGGGSRFRGERAPGGYAEFVAALPADVVRLPDALSFVDGALLPCGIGTGLHALRRLGGGVGETLLVVGAGGGVGIHAVALAHAAGLRVIAVTRAEGKRAALLAAGADSVVAAAADPLAEIRRLAPEGVPLAIDCAGPPTLELTLQALARGGRAALVGNVADAPLDGAALVGRAIVRELTLLGSPHATIDELALAARLVERGTVRPQVAATFPLEQAEQAHRMLEESAPADRVVLVVDPANASAGRPTQLLFVQCRCSVGRRGTGESGPRRRRRPTM
ncbi:MAG: zinc-binding dehydrogenase [Conexibacter sp.]|nr:zinc-binding dehydrogenase [Conexibacter sp.]